MILRIRYLLLLLSLLLVACGDSKQDTATTDTTTTQQQPQSQQMSLADHDWQPDEYMLHYEVTNASFSDVIEFIKLAINGRGIKINNISYIGKMLARTKEAVGASKTVYLDGQAQAIEFCSSTVSRATMEASPHNIIYCPYIIIVYVIPDQPDVVHVAFRRPLLVGDEASRKSLQAIEELVKGIIEEAIQ
jgi:hypothetical protein